MVDLAMQTYGTIPNLKIRLIFAEKKQETMQIPECQGY